MRRLILALWIGLASAGNALADEAGPCPPKVVTTFNLQYDRDGRPTIEASFYGRPERLLVDTAGYYGMLSWNTANELGLHRDLIRRHQIYLLNGSSMEYTATAFEVRMGADLYFESYRFLVMPPDWRDLDSDGTIAPDTLEKYDLDLDFDAKTLTLNVPARCGSSVVRWTHDPFVALPVRSDAYGNLHLTVELDGTSMDAVIDTGSSYSILRLDEAEAMLGRTLGRQDLVHEGTESDRGWDTYRHSFKLLTSGGLVVHDPNIIIMTDKLSQIREPEEINYHWRVLGMQAPPLIIGMSVLRGLHIYVARKEDMLYVTNADAH